MAIYKRNFLNKVVFRVDFEDVELGKLKEFYPLIKKEFPTEEQKKGFEGSFALNMADGDVKQERKEFFAWMFHSKSKNKRLLVCSKYIILEYDDYKNAQELLDDVQNTISVFLSKFNVATINRIGLRYLNKIELKEDKPLNWDNYLNKDLISNLQFATKNKIKLARCMGQMVIKEDVCDIVFNFGIWNSDYPSEINRKEFILDFDCRSKFPAAVSDIEITQIAKNFNSKVENLFELSITNKFRSLLKK